jgi:hypothetical protein
VVPSSISAVVVRAGKTNVLMGIENAVIASAGRRGNSSLDYGIFDHEGHEAHEVSNQPRGVGRGLRALRGEPSELD